MPFNLHSFPFVMALAGEKLLTLPHADLMFFQRQRSSTAFPTQHAKRPFYVCFHFSPCCRSSSANKSG